MFDRWESQWRRGFLGSSQFLSNWNIINPRRSWTLRVVILIFLRAIIKDDEELWRDRRANAMLRNSFSANSGPWNGRGEVCHQCRWYETQCAIHFNLYTLQFRVRPNPDFYRTFENQAETNIRTLLGSSIQFRQTLIWPNRKFVRTLFYDLGNHEKVLETIKTWWNVLWAITRAARSLLWWIWTTLQEEFVIEQKSFLSLPSSFPFLLQRMFLTYMYKIFRSSTEELKLHLYFLEESFIK